jgi:hypothetical protein
MQDRCHAPAARQVSHLHSNSSIGGVGRRWIDISTYRLYVSPYE